MSAHAKVLRELADADGAILCWQVSDSAAFLRALNDGAIRFDGETDCYAHPEAVQFDGNDGAYSMTAGPCPTCKGIDTEHRSGEHAGENVAYRFCCSCDHEWDHT